MSALRPRPAFVRRAARFRGTRPTPPRRALLQHFAALLICTAARAPGSAVCSAILLVPPLDEGYTYGAAPCAANLSAAHSWPVTCVVFHMPVPVSVGVGHISACRGFPPVILQWTAGEQNYSIISPPQAAGRADRRQEVGDVERVPRARPGRRGVPGK